MHKFTLFLSATLLIFAACNQPTPIMKPISFTWPSAKAPVAPMKQHDRIMHNDTVTDHYYWMIDYFKKGPDSSLVIDYLKKENEYLDTMMKGAKPLREKLFIEMKSRIKEKDESVPVFRNGYYYYERTEEGKEYYKYCRKKGSLNAQEEVLLDVDKMAEGKAYFDIAEVAVSEDNKLIAYGVDEVSRREYTIYIKNIETGETYPDKVERTEGAPVWANDNKTIFYTSKNPTTLLSEKIKRHVLGTPATSDVTVYEEKDKSNYIGVEKSKNKQFILIHSQATLSSEVHYIQADQPTAPFRIFASRQPEVLYCVTPLEDKFLVLTNWNAKNFRLMECTLEKTDSKYWKEVIPHKPDILLTDVEAFRDFLVFSERKNGLVQLRIKNRKTGKEVPMEFEEPAYAANVGANPEYDSKLLRFQYTSLITPKSVNDFNMETYENKLLKQDEIIGGYDKSHYACERLFAKANDGTSIPISIVYKKGWVKNGQAPLLLYGYGSYGYSLDASFSSTRLSLLDRGFAFAIAHIRGGEEMGRSWYDDGKMMNKKNTFTDFIDCAEYLIKEKYTSPKHLYAQGGSAGGLLMGAVINIAPELWNGVIAQVPFVDVVNTMLDESIPLTTNEFDEWGNPKEKEAYFYMKSYSPYENVEKKKYPNLLVATGLHDSQVQYFEPAKWVAKLRTMKTDNNILLLHTEMNFGHGGASGRFDYLKDIALNYAFLLVLEGKLE